MKNILRKIFASKFWWLFLLLVLFGVNYLAAVVHARFDLTREKRYTLSKGTKDLLKNLDSDVRIDVFLKGDFPAGFRKLTNSIREFLGLLKETNSRKIQFSFIAPSDEIPDAGGMRYADSLEKMGAFPITLKAQVKEGENSSVAYPFAVINYHGRQELVTLFSVPALSGATAELPEKVINSAEALLEYQFISSLDKLTNTSKPGIAYSTGNGEPVDGRTYDLVSSLDQSYQLKTLNLNEHATIPDSVRLLMVVKPTRPFSDDEKLKIDQFVMNGGKLLLFIDNLIAEQDSLAIKPETIAYDRNLNLTDLLFKYGLRINTDLVMDLRCDYIPIIVGGSMENPQMQFLHWNYYPLLSSGENPITRNLGYVSSRFANSIDTIAVKGVKKTPLLVSSPNSRIISTPALISLNENKNVPEDEKFRKNAIPVAMLLEGSFTSLYLNRMARSQLDSLRASGKAFNGISGDNKMIVVADGDIVLNDFVPSDGPNSQPIPLQMGWNKYTFTEYQKQTELGQFFYPAANKQFLLNCVEYLISNPAISQTRNKEIVLRLLDPKKVSSQKSTWQLVNIALPVLVILLFGWVYQQIRKKKYAA